MRSRIAPLLAVLSLGAGTPLVAQTPDWVSQILTAARLPVVATEARQEGAPSDEIRAVLEAMTRANVPAHEATVVLDTARAVRREHGPTDNFGAFVQTQLAAGKRGQALAAAIRAEHAQRGKGKGARGASEQDRGRVDDRADTTRGRGRGRSDTLSRGRKPDIRGRDRGNPARPDR
jgi:hypothetical protein